MVEDVYSFGSWVGLRRQALVLSREELAHRVGVAEVSIRKIEADERRPSPQVAALLAQHLQLAPETHALFVQVARGVLAVEQLPPPVPGAELSRSSAPAVPAVTSALLPSGMVTFLFTDIEGSTKLWEQHPDAMPTALARHDAILRQAITAHGGVVFKTVGDAVYAAFARAPDALAAALAAQRALQAEPWAFGSLRVRMALHTGVAELRAGDYFGLPLSRVTRLLGAGHGGQVLISHVTQQLVNELLPEGVELSDLGKHQLKDLTQPEQIFQLAAPDLPPHFPPLRTPDPRRNNLPAQPTPLIGRERETAQIVTLLRRTDVRLVTLSGPGGTGKTRLGLEVVAVLLEDFGDGVYFVDLSPIRDVALVASAIAQTLTIQETGRQPPLDQLKSYLREKQLLLVLDNFEQVSNAAALVAELLAGCRRLKILVTSRVVLKVRGEKEIQVPPLALPNLRQLPPSDQLSHYAAVELFIQRALDVQPTFAVTNENAPAVAEICVRLDGLPLAIELAAARLKLFAPEALLARLSRRLPLLTGGARDLPARQQTLRNAIEWSYNLLIPAEQRLFWRLSVFVGGWTLEAAEAVCDIDGDLGLDVLEGMQVLVDNSLVRQVEGLDSAPRFRRLETIREYAVERLEASGEAEALRRRHAEYFLALAERANTQLQRQGQEVLDRLEAEHDNLSAALAWALGRENVELGIRLTLALAGIRQHGPGFWQARGYLSEGYQWLNIALSRSRDVAPTLRAMILERLSGFVWALRSTEQAMAMSKQALALFRAAGDTPGIARLLLRLGTLLDMDDPQATQLLEESLARYQELGDQMGIAKALHALGDLARDRGDLVLAADLLEKSVAIFREAGGNEAGLALALNGLADVALLQDNNPRATMLYWESLRLLQNVGDRGTRIWPLRNLGWLAIVQGEDARVRELLEEHVDWFRDKQSDARYFLLHILGGLNSLQDDAKQATVLLREALALQLQFHADLIRETLDGFAWLAAGQRQLERAARLLGATESMLVGGFATWRTAHKHFVAAVHAQLDEGTFAVAWAAGQAMTLEQAIAYALEEDA